LFQDERISLVFWKTSDPAVTMKNFKSVMSEHLNLHSSTNMRRRNVGVAPMHHQEAEKEQDQNFAHRFNAFDNIHSLDNINMSEEQRLQMEKEVEEHLKQMNLKDDEGTHDENKK